MKIIILLMFCAALAVTAEETYESINDNFDIAEVLNNDRLLKSYVKCLLNNGPCTPEVKQLRDKLPEALETRCSKCTEKQKHTGKQLVKEVKSNHPHLWKELVDMYDPDGKYQTSFKDFFETK